ncbi:MAG: hypothetical protein HOW73_50340 [Polyangiaceae bacterium]|nr:hypothetical protein [Polyangiaceae bacterium]
MSRNRVLLIASSLLTASYSMGCVTVLGTSDYEPCEEDTCPNDDGGGSAGTGGGGNGSGGGQPTTTTTTTSGPDCFNVTMMVSGNVKVRLQEIDVDFEGESSVPVCLPPGTKTFVAECDASGGDDPVVDVSWGNDACTDGTSTCSLDLQAAETFTVASDACP